MEQNVTRHTPQIFMMRIKKIYIVASPAASIAAMSDFFFGILGMSILISVSESLFIFIWPLTISGASMSACQSLNNSKGYDGDLFLDFIRNRLKT